MSELYERLQQHGRERPSTVAVWHYHRGDFSPTTYGQLAESARRFADAFASTVPVGGLIPMCVARTPDSIAAMVGALGAGCAFSFINKKLRGPQIERILSDSQASLAVADGPGLMALKASISDESVIAQAQWWLVKGPRFGRVHERVAEKLRAVTKVDVWAENATREAEPSRRQSDASPLGCCLFTSGSTGSPKGVLVGRDDLCARARAEANWYELDRDDVLLSLLPFSFDVGLNQLLSSLWIGCQLVLLDSWFPRDIMNAVQARKVTGISGVPSIWLDFQTQGHTFHTQGVHASLRFLTVSGGDLSPRDLDRLPDIANGVGIFKTYGQTEAFRATSLKPHEFGEKRSSVGRAFEGACIYVVGPDGEPVMPGEEGEIVHTGLGLMRGYLDGNDPQNKLRANPFRSPRDPCRHAIFTGDRGYLDADGYLFLLGRQDDMVKVQGNRVYPAEVHAQLLSIDGLSQTEVISVETLGTAYLVAFVVFAASKTVEEEHVLRAMADRVPSYMLPALVVPKKSLPRTASGKTDRHALTLEAVHLLQNRARRGEWISNDHEAA